MILKTKNTSDHYYHMDRNDIGEDLFSTYARFSEKPTFLTPDMYTYVPLRDKKC